jgi:Lactoylglutathione lyase and related lyases
MKLGKMMIFVSDLPRAKRFYCDILGFPLRSEKENRFDLIHEGCDFVVFKCEKDAIIEDYGNVARSVYVFEVDSVEKQWPNSVSPEFLSFIRLRLKMNSAAMPRFRIRLATFTRFLNENRCQPKK